MLSDTILTNFACGLFNLSTLLCAYQIATSEYSNIRSPSRKGWSYRRCLHVLLFFANLSRAASIVTEIYVHESDKTNFYLVLNFIAHSVPRVLTFSTHTMVLLFLGHLWTILTRQTFHLIRPFVIATNAAAYLACSTIAGCASALSDHSQLVIFSLWVLGSVNCLAGIVACTYSKDIVLHMLSPNLRGQPVSWSLISLSTVCVCALFGNAAWLLAAALMRDRLDDFAHLKMQVACWVSSEFIPTMLLLAITSSPPIARRSSVSLHTAQTMPTRFAWLSSQKLMKQGVVPLPMRDSLGPNAVKNTSSGGNTRSRSMMGPFRTTTTPNAPYSSSGTRLYSRQVDTTPTSASITSPSSVSGIQLDTIGSLTTPPTTTMQQQVAGPPTTSSFANSTPAAIVSQTHPPHPHVTYHHSTKPPAPSAATTTNYSVLADMDFDLEMNPNQSECISLRQDEARRGDVVGYGTNSI